MIFLEIDTTSMFGVIFGSVLVFTAIPFLINIYRIKKKEKSLNPNHSRKNTQLPFKQHSYGIGWYQKHRL